MDSVPRAVLCADKASQAWERVRLDMECRMIRQKIWWLRISRSAHR